MIALNNGIGSRVKSISRELACPVPRRIDWIINHDCPVGFRHVFPNGIDGLDVIESEQGRRLGQVYAQNPDETRIAESVQKVFAAMELPDVGQFSLGILYRGFFWKIKPLEAFLAEIREELPKHIGLVPTLCGNARAEIMAALDGRGLPQTSNEMAHDFDRQSDSIRDFLLEWKRVVHCKTVLCNHHQTTLLWPNRFLTLPNL